LRTSAPDFSCFSPCSLRCFCATRRSKRGTEALRLVFPHRRRSAPPLFDALLVVQWKCSLLLRVAGAQSDFPRENPPLL
jgi:hypothetical protein